MRSIKQYNYIHCVSFTYWIDQNLLECSTKHFYFSLENVWKTIFNDFFFVLNLLINLNIFAKPVNPHNTIQPPPKWHNFLDLLASTCRAYHSRISQLEDEKYDLEYIVKGKDYQVHIEISEKKTSSATTRYKKKTSLTLNALFSNFFYLIFFKQSLIFHFNLEKKNFPPFLKTTFLDF